MSGTKTIAVGSKNPVKANAIRLAFERIFPRDTFDTESYGAPSGVADQPKSDHETLSGACNRMHAVREALPQADFWVGIEGGIEDTAEGMNAFAWIVVSSNSTCGKSRTATFPLPHAIADLIRQGVELGHATDQVFGRDNTKHKEGAIGVLSDNVIDRTMLYEHAALMALVALKNSELYQRVE
jgi:inosine/xanthosine triphosphatase